MRALFFCIRFLLSNAFVDYGHNFMCPIIRLLLKDERMDYLLVQKKKVALSKQKQRMVRVINGQKPDIIRKR